MSSKLYVSLICIFGLHESYGVIYRLNDTEYEKLPRLFEMDNYESCMEQPGAVYCVANLELYNDTPNDLYTLIQEYSEHYFKHYNYSHVDRGVCVMKHCKSYADNAGLDVERDLPQVLEGCLDHKIRHKYNLRARMYNMNCEDQRHRNIDAVDYILLTIIIILVLLNVVGSYYDGWVNENKVKDYKTKGMELLLCFSVPRNMKDLREIQSETRSNLFRGLHGIRVIATFIVLYIHIILVISSGFTADPHTFEKAYEFVGYRIIFIAINIVQVFFFISGLLLAITLQACSENFVVTWEYIPQMIIKRWWRLTPPAAMVIGFMASWMRHVSYGPLWDFSITNGPTKQCREYFWAHIFYVNNYLPEDTSCAMQTWHIATDMQLNVLGLIIHFIIINRSRNVKITIFSLLLLIGTVTPMAQVWLQDLDAFAMITPEVARTLSSKILRNFHMFGHNNLICFITGMANGYLAWHYLNKVKQNYSNVKVTTLLNCSLIPLYVGVLYCGNLFIRDGERAPLIFRTLYSAASMLTLSVVFSLWLLGLILKGKDSSQSLLEWPGWVIPSKLSYSVYLLHSVLLHIILGIRTQLSPVSFFDCFLVYIGVVVVSFLVALPFYLLVEAPARRITTVIMEPKIKAKQS